MRGNNIYFFAWQGEMQDGIAGLHVSITRQAGGFRYKENTGAPCAGVACGDLFFLLVVACSRFNACMGLRARALLAGRGSLDSGLGLVSRLSLG